MVLVLLQDKADAPLKMGIERICSSLCQSGIGCDKVAYMREDELLGISVQSVHDFCVNFLPLELIG
jgi:hypothetical protein